VVRTQWSGPGTDSDGQWCRCTVSRNQPAQKKKHPRSWIGWFKLDFHDFTCDDTFDCVLLAKQRRLAHSISVRPVPSSSPIRPTQRRGRGLEGGGVEVAAWSGAAHAQLVSRHPTPHRTVLTTVAGPGRPPARPPTRCPAQATASVKRAKRKPATKARAAVPRPTRSSMPSLGGSRAAKKDANLKLGTQQRMVAAQPPRKKHKPRSAKPGRQAQRNDADLGDTNWLPPPPPQRTGIAPHAT
jgi:hypothetical protein